MRVGVGSGNPVKVAATERALSSETDTFAADATVVSEPVPSGVSEQPRGHAETRQGAVNRAAAVVATGETHDLGVGIEGGVTDSYDAVSPELAGTDTEGATVDDSETGGVPAGGDELVLIMWAAVTDGERTGVGAGPTIPLPAAVGERVRGGAELGPVMDDVLDESGTARDRGASGVVTGGRVDRTVALSTAVAGALAPFVTDLFE